MAGKHPIRQTLQGLASRPAAEQAIVIRQVAARVVEMRSAGTPPDRSGDNSFKIDGDHLSFRATLTDGHVQLYSGRLLRTKVHTAVIATPGTDGYEAVLDLQAALTDRPRIGVDAAFADLQAKTEFGAKEISRPSGSIQRRLMQWSREGDLLVGEILCRNDYGYLKWHETTRAELRNTADGAVEFTYALVNDGTVRQYGAWTVDAGMTSEWPGAEHLRALVERVERNVVRDVLAGPG
jgi:hypothetical protein